MKNVNRTADAFESHRPRLFGIAYRMLGTRADAEDLVQDAYLRWHQAATPHVESALAFLITLTRRLCLDRLRERKHRWAESMGLSVSESILDHAPAPEAQLEVSEEVSWGLGVVLERLSATERAAFLLHDVFDYDYPEVAQLLCKSEQSCRQTVHRARAHLREPHARFRVTPQSRERALNEFLVAVGTADRHVIPSLVASA